MASKFVNSIVNRAASGWDATIGKLGGSRRGKWRIGVEPYRCFGSGRKLRFACRVLKEPDRYKASIHDSAWLNLKAIYHRLESDEIPGANLRVKMGGQSIAVSSDEEGYAFGVLEIQGADPIRPGWHELGYEIIDLPFGTQMADSFAAECLIPSPEAQFGLISDIDDTVLHTQVGSRLKMLVWTLTHNSYTRLALPGVVELYRDLAAEHNPTFYVSSSPWNLYQMLKEFIDTSGLPRGPLMLRDLGLGANSSLAGDHSHKEDKIITLLATYPQMQFILLGDSGQEDAAIYGRVSKNFPDRILCSYIRDTGHVNRAMIAEGEWNAQLGGSELLVMKDSDSIRAHALKNGWLKR